MANRDRDLLAEIERDVLDESKPVEPALLKCLTLGGRAGSVDLREWATRELRGYVGHEEELPDYRHVFAPLLMDGLSGGYKITGESVSVIDLPEEARDVLSDELPLTSGIGKIEALIRQADSRGGFLQMGPPAGAELARMMTHNLGDPRRHVERVYWTVSAADLRGVVSAIRIALTELVAELRAGMAEGEQVPSAELAGQAFRVGVHGDKNRVTITHAAAGPPAALSPRPGTAGRKSRDSGQPPGASAQQSWGSPRS